MPRKVSGRRIVESFLRELDQIDSFLAEIETSDIAEKSRSWSYEYAVIRMYRAFEHLYLELLVAVLNADTSLLSRATGTSFPRHVRKDACAYIVTGGGYFDFRGRSGLISTLGKFLPKDHWLVETARDRKYRSTIERLVALRNSAAHQSPNSRRAAIEATGSSRLGSTGSWLKASGRFAALSDSLRSMGNDLTANLRY
jgi:hypothetical protein